jgi:hypothetical protein
MPETIEIRLLCFPVDVYVRYREYLTELMREFALIAFRVPDAPGGTVQARHHDVPARLLDLVDDLRATYASVAQPATDDRERAIQAGLASVDLLYVAPPSIAEDMMRLGTMLEEADEFCRSDRLLTLETPPEEKAFRDWYVSEIVRQAAGEEPTAWTAARVP